MGYSLGTTFFFNPGSVGVVYDRHQPDDGGPRLDLWAEYAVLTSDDGWLGLEFRPRGSTVPPWRQIMLGRLVIQEGPGKPHKPVHVGEVRGYAERDTHHAGQTQHGAAMLPCSAPWLGGVPVEYVWW